MKRKPLQIIRALALGLCFLTLLCACEKTPAASYADSVFTGMDTAITLRLGTDGVDNAALGAASARCRDIVAELESILSCHDEKSELSALNGDVHLMLQGSETLLSVLDTAWNMHDLTGGAYDPTLGTLTSLWNVSGGGPVPKADAIAEAMNHIGTDKITVDGTSILKSDTAVQIDLGGVGKGYALQELLTCLSATDIPYGIVSIGGNIGVFGQKPDGLPYQIGIRDPNDTDSVVGYLYIPNGFVSVSGDYERFFRQDGVIYHHILDPETGYPADTGLASVAVWTQNGASADALSTALFVMGVEEGLAFYETGSVDFEAVFITKDNKIHVTAGLAEKEMFALTAGGYTAAEQ